MKDILIYAKTIKEYFSKKPSIKLNDPLTIHVMGKLSDIMLGKSIPVKYGDLGNLIMIVQINGVDMAVINVITYATMITLGPWNLKPTPTILELADQSTIRPVGKLEDITILVDSWKYPIDLLVLHTQSPADGNLLILGRPWLATADAYIGCRSGNMVISNGEVTNNLILYSPVEPSSSNKPGLTSIQKPLPMKEPKIENEEFIPILTISKVLCFKDETEDDAINTFLSSPKSVSNLTRQLLESVMS